MGEIIIDAEVEEVTYDNIVKVSNEIKSLQDTFSTISLEMIEKAADRFTDGSLSDQEKLLSAVATIAKMKKFVEICEKKKGIKDEMTTMMKDVFDQQGVKGIKNWESVNITCKGEEIWNYEDDKQWAEIFGKMTKREGELNVLKQSLKSREKELQAIAKNTPDKAKVTLKGKMFKNYQVQVK